MKCSVEFRQFEGDWWTVKEGLTLDEAIERFDPYAGMTPEEAQNTTLLIQTRIVDEHGVVRMEWGAGEDNREELSETCAFIERFVEKVLANRH